MNPTIVGLIVFACAFGGALLGFWLRTRSPEHLLNGGSRDAVIQSIGLVATMTALMLGLIVASAKSSFDAVDVAVKSGATDVLTLDRVLARYGPETGEVRDALKQALARRIEMIWPQASSRPVQIDLSGVSPRVEGVAERIHALTPRDDTQRSLQAHAVTIAERLLEAKWVVFAGSKASIPVPLLVVMVFWLMIAFTAFGLLGTQNTTVATVLFLCALSVGSAVFLILEMDEPFVGLIKVSADPLRFAYDHLNQ